MDKTNQLINLIKTSKKTVFLGGAGVSTESGLKDFRSKDGLYNEKYDYPPEIILSRSFFKQNPKEFYKFYKEKMNSLNFKPNTTHLVLKELEKLNLISCIITQNIDGFHQEAGSKNVLELHGSIKRNYCPKCNKFYDAEYIFNKDELPICKKCNEIIKPDVVLYEEPLNEEILNNSIKEISSADLLIIGGTSLNVYPAAGLINYFKGKNIVIINKDITPYDYKANLVINENITDVFNKIKKEIVK